MSVPTTLPPYTKPGFGLRHAAQVAYINNTSPGANGSFAREPLSASENSAHLQDSLAGKYVRLAVPTDSSLGAGYEIRRTNASTTLLNRPRVNFFGLLGQNWYRTRSYFLAYSHPNGGSALGITYPGQAGSTINEIGMPGGAHWLDVGDQSGGDYNVDERMQIAFYNGTPSNTEPVALGEFFATYIERPTNGISHSWTWDIEENLLRTTTQASADYTTKRGPSRRAFSLEQTDIPASEANFWKRVIATLAEGSAFVYMPPEYGQAIVPRIVTDDAADWALTVAGGAPAASTLTVSATGHDPLNSDTILISPSGADLGSAHRFATTSQAFPNGAEDWSDKWLRFDLRVYDWTWLTLANQLRVIVGSGSAAYATGFDMSHFFLGTNRPNAWVRCYVDLQNHPDQGANTLGGADLTAIDSLSIEYTPLDAGDQLAICNVDLIDPRRLPALVTATRHSMEQDSDSPLADPTYTVKLEMVESLA